MTGVMIDEGIHSRYHKTTLKFKTTTILKKSKESNKI
jgi:hypothetical protein